jgi:hypothetical protein
MKMTQGAANAAASDSAQIMRIFFRFDRASANPERVEDFRHAFDEVVDGLRINFGPGARVKCFLAPKSSPFLSPPDSDSVVRVQIDDIGNSKFVSLEREFGAEDWRGAKRFRIILAGVASFPMSASLIFRLFKANGQFTDFCFASFGLSPKRAVLTFSGALDDPLFSDPGHVRARLLLFGEPRAMTWDLHYLSVELLG